MSVDDSDFISVLRTEPPVAHLSATGELDAFTAGQMSRQVSDAVAAGCTNFRLDLGGVTFIDAAGIGVLVRTRATSITLGGAFELVAASACVRRLCALVDLADVFGLETTSSPIDSVEAGRADRAGSGRQGAGTWWTRRGIA